MTEREEAIYNRTLLLLGREKMGRLNSARVIIFGIGGVGSWCAEGLLRSGMTRLTLVDCDNVSISNVNRQLMATTLTVGMPKVDALRRRLLEINPDAQVEIVNMEYNQQSADSFALSDYDYVVDAIDSLSNKALLISRASCSGAKVYSSMGSALKINPLGLKVADIWDVKGCPLGFHLRKKLRHDKLPVQGRVTCVYDEEVLPNLGHEDGISPASDAFSARKATTNGTCAHITALFGLTLSGLIIQDCVG